MMYDIHDLYLITNHKEIVFIPITMEFHENLHDPASAPDGPIIVSDMYGVDR